jgi:uncharacterized membrane protein YukC
MKDKVIFKKRMTLDGLIQFFYCYNRWIDFGIITLVLLSVGLLFYFYIFNPIMDFNQSVNVDQVFLSRNVYDNVWSNFSKRSEKPREIINKAYSDPFQ